MSLMIVFWGLVGCGVSTTPSKTQSLAGSSITSKGGSNGSKGSAAPQFTLSRLDNLTNYQYQAIIQGPDKTSIVGFVNSRTNYQSQTTMTVPNKKPSLSISREVGKIPYLYIPGFGWLKGAPFSPSLFDYVTFTMDALGNPHRLRFVKTGAIAGRPAREYRIIPVDAPRLFTTIWVEDKTGALLEYVQAALRLPGNVGVSTSTFVVTRVGGVPAWTVPRLAAIQ
ncbi:MAG: hypothetical protein ACYCVB_04615 [Bacilli bacterium]